MQENQDLDFAERLRVLRDSQYITQQTLADYIGVSRPTISGYETKGYQPSHEKLQKIAELLNVSIDYLINGGAQDLELLSFDKSADKQQRTELIRLYSSLSYRNRKQVVEYVRFMSNSEKN